MGYFSFLLVIERVAFNRCPMKISFWIHHFSFRMLVSTIVMTNSKSIALIIAQRCFMMVKKGNGSIQIKELPIKAEEIHFFNMNL